MEGNETRMTRTIGDGEWMRRYALARQWYESHPGLTPKEDSSDPVECEVAQWRTRQVRGRGFEHAQLMEQIPGWTYPTGIKSHPL